MATYLSSAGCVSALLSKEGLFLLCVGCLEGDIREPKIRTILTKVVDGKAKVCLLSLIREGEGERRAC
jgi:hypothetical protein